MLKRLPTSIPITTNRARPAPGTRRATTFGAACVWLRLEGVHTRPHGAGSSELRAGRHATWRHASLTGPVPHYLCSDVATGASNSMVTELVQASVARSTCAERKATGAGGRRCGSSSTQRCAESMRLRGQETCRHAVSSSWHGVVRFRQEGVRAAHGEGVLPRSKRPALRGGPHMHALRNRAASQQPRPGEAASLQSSVLKAEAQNSKRSQADGKSVKAGMRLSSTVFCWRWCSCKFYRMKAADPRRAASTTSPSRSGGRLNAPCFTQAVNRGSRIAK